MILRFLKISLLLSSFIFLTGFLPVPAIIGPGFTIASTGNLFKAGAQLLIDHEVKKKTGKNSLAYVKEEVVKKNNQKDLNHKLRKLVEKRVKISHEKIVKQNQQKELNKELINLVDKRIKIAHKKLKIKKINQ
tara:strand:- start:1655 stop:2053 length:399 start_codon:yes stop_codon:yes gene_type:complete